MGYCRPGRIRAATTHVLLEITCYPHRICHRHAGLAGQRHGQVDRRGALDLRRADTRHPRRLQVRPAATRGQRDVVELRLARAGRAGRAADRRAGVQGVLRAQDRGRRRRLRGRDPRVDAHARGRPHRGAPPAEEQRPRQRGVGADQGRLLCRVLRRRAARARLRPPARARRPPCPVLDLPLRSLMYPGSLSPISAALHYGSPPSAPDAHVTLAGPRSVICAFESLSPCLVSLLQRQWTHILHS